MLSGIVQPSSAASTSVLLVDAGLGKTTELSSAPGEPSGSWALLRTPSLRSAFDLLTARAFDCVLVHLGLPGSDSAETWQQLRRHAGEAALLALADHPEGHPEGHDQHVGRRLADDVVVRAELDAPYVHRLLARTVHHVQQAGELRRAQDSARLLSALVDNTTDAVFSTSLDGVIASWNRGAEQLYGWNAEEAIGRHVRMLYPPGVDELGPIMGMVSRGEPVRGLETVRRSKDGRLVDVSLTVCPVHSAAGEVTGASVVARNISDRRELETELVRAFMHDGLTGLPNRAFLVDRLSRLLAKAAQHRAPVAVLFLDLDRFKSINEAQGHFAGDRVLDEVASRLRAVTRGVDTVARLGGDEFVLVCPETDMETAAWFAQQVIDALARPMRIEGRSVRISASIGIAVTPPLDADAEGLLRHADAAMYEAKARGRSRAQIFDVSFAERTREQLVLADDLREALASDGLDLHYQPMVGLDDERLAGIEALVRWQHPTRGVVAPGVFVPAAEHRGFVTEIDRWVLARACRDTRAGLLSGLLPPGLRVSVNLSARSLVDSGLVALVEDVLRAESLPATALVLEITETALLHDVETARRNLDGLRALGTGIALDDFGTGYSSLSFLRELPVTQVKIDRSFITNIDRNGEDLLITESVVDLGRGLGLETVAEGVESEAQRRQLQLMGCGVAQGHLWSAAVPLDRLGAPLRRTPVGGVAPLGPRTPVDAPGAGRRWARSRRRPPANPAS
jgi:diguanylate cyclase (GGDEF)-like protein/PAS domain S-box-containing protein